MVENFTKVANLTRFLKETNNNICVSNYANYICNISNIVYPENDVMFSTFVKFSTYPFISLLLINSQRELIIFI